MSLRSLLSIFNPDEQLRRENTDRYNTRLEEIMCTVTTLRQRMAATTMPDEARAAVRDAFLVAHDLVVLEELLYQRGYRDTTEGKQCMARINDVMTEFQQACITVSPEPGVRSTGGSRQGR